MLNKDEFIEDYISFRKVKPSAVTAFLDLIEGYEKEYNKSAIDFTKSELIEIYSTIKTKSPRTLANKHGYLKAWAQYAYPDRDSDIYSIGLNDFKKCTERKGKTILTREQLTKLQDKLINPVDKAIYECIWEGVIGEYMKDLMSIDTDCIDHDTMTITVNGNVYPMTERLEKLIMAACEEFTYTSYGIRETTVALERNKLMCKYPVNRPQPNELTDDMRFRWVYRKIRNTRDIGNFENLSSKDIAFSGCLYYIKRGMISNKLPLNEYCRTDEGKKLLDRYGYTTKGKDYVSNIMKDFGWAIK